MKVEVTKLFKKYQKNYVLYNVDFAIESGTVCGLLGINGAGKSTLMKIMFDLIPADKGTIFFDGKSSNNTQIGALIEGPAIYNNLSAFDNLKTKALLYDISNEKIFETIKLVGLTNAGKKKAGKFSIGMKQRLGIGMALLTSPKFLILDEPTNGLDPDGIMDLLDLIRNLKLRGVTILISSHQLHEIRKIADQIIILNEGRINYNNLNDKSDDLEQIFFNCVHGEGK